MTDAEVICSFMEKTPRRVRYFDEHMSSATWWRRDIVQNNGQGIVYSDWTPCELTLDALREVQRRLTDEQWHEYERGLRCVPFDGPVNSVTRVFIHATAEQKIRALAVVLR